MKLSQEVLDICHDAVDEHPDDLESSLLQALRKVRGLDNFAEIQDQLVREAIQNTIYQRRHTRTATTNQAIRNDVKKYGGPAGVVMADSKTVQRHHATAFEYKIGGQTLGDLRGKDIPVLIGSIRNRAEIETSHLYLLQELEGRVDELKTVRRSVDLAELERLMNETSERARNTARRLGTRTQVPS